MRIKRLLGTTTVVLLALLVGLVAAGIVAVRQAHTADEALVAQLLAGNTEQADTEQGDRRAGHGERGAIAYESDRALSPPLPTASSAPAGATAAQRSSSLAPRPLAITAFPDIAPPPVGASPAEPAPTPFDSELQDRLRRIVSFPQIRVDSPYGIAVVDGWGRDVFGSNADTALLPASTNKLVVAAAVVHTFGPDQRFRTAITATAKPDARGVVHGDLVVVGGGDPVLSSPAYAELVYRDRPQTRITELVDAVQAAGITAVSGQVLADPGVFGGRSEQPGFVPGYYDRLEGTRTAGLTVDAGLKLTVRDDTDTVIGVAADDPSLQAAAVVTALLEERGIRVAGAPARVDVREQHGGSLTARTVTLLGTATSPPLSEILVHMVQRSDNSIADTLFRVVGAVHAEATWKGSSRAVRRVLAPLQLDWTGVRLSDGSGLSRTNRLTAGFLAHLDEQMMSSPHAGRWRALMAVAGRSGTLSARYRGTPAAGRVFAKTGALRDVRSLAGSVDAPADPASMTEPYRYHFAVVGSELSGADIAPLRRMMDLVVLALAADQHGCAGWSPPVPTGAASDPSPESLVCP